MKTSILSKNIDLTPEIKKYIENKMNDLNKVTEKMGDSLQIFFEIAIETKHHQKGAIYYAEANIEVPGKIIRAEAKEENIYTAINKVKDELERSLEKYKDLHFKK